MCYGNLDPKHAMRDIDARVKHLSLTGQDETKQASLVSFGGLIARLRELGGTSESVIANEELLELILPILRADFLLCGSFAYGRREPLAAAGLRLRHFRAARAG